MANKFSEKTRKLILKIEKNYFNSGKSHLVMYQIYGTWQSLAFAVCLDLAHGKAFLCRVP